jgi:NAD(P)-dependent dehydrogenase (short-subunit alcohol dehydrogenase family)
MPNVLAVPCDVTDPEQVVAAARTVDAHTGGKLDLLINNAGYAPHDGVIEAANMSEYRRAFEVNFWGPLHVVRAMSPLLRASKGRIINNTSSSVYMTIPMYSAYPTSKAALKILTQHLRMELAPFGIGVTSLEPGSVETPMVETGAEAEERQWASIPEPLRDQYRQHFLALFTVVANKATLAQPDAFADAVWKRIISARRLRPSYLIGPSQVAVLPWLHRLLPAQQAQNITGRMFATKSGASDRRTQRHGGLSAVGHERSQS